MTSGGPTNVPACAAPAALAERLRAAYADGPVPPLRDGLDPDDGPGAYAVQALNTRYWLGTGRRIVGRKIGLTSAAIQERFGVAEPDAGVLFADMQIDDGGTLDMARTLQPRVEAEIAFILGRDIDGRAPAPEELLGAVGSVVAALEIVDSRIEGWQISLADTVADNASSAFFVLGREHRKPRELDLLACEMLLELNGRPASRGNGSATMGHPLNAFAWLAGRLAASGEGLRRGDVVLTGALGPMVPLAAGDRVRAAIAGLGSVSLDCR